MAERVALHLLRRVEAADGLVESIRTARERLRRCTLCGDFIEADPAAEEAPCERCLDPHRDARLLCVVEEVGDLHALERSRAYRGRYHVLGGVLSALDGVGPEDLRLDVLRERATQGVEEVIVATNPSLEGETTATFLAELLRPAGVRVTRLAYGLPSGSVIQYADEFTLAQALEGRRALSA
jgi:recombination protein RecR